MQVFALHVMFTFPLFYNLYMIVYVSLTCAIIVCIDMPRGAFILPLLETTIIVFVLGYLSHVPILYSVIGYHCFPLCYMPFYCSQLILPCIVETTTHLIRHMHVFVCRLIVS